MDRTSLRTWNLGLGMLLALLLTACGASATPPTGTAATSTASTVEATASTLTSTAATSTAAAAESMMAHTAHSTAEPTMLPAASASAAPSATTQASNEIPAETQVEIKLFMFKPNELNVKTGTTVVWTNQDAIDHSVTAGKPGAQSDAFDSDFFQQNGSFTFTFTEPGQYDYFCKRHESMIGKVNVTAP